MDETRKGLHYFIMEEWIQSNMLKYLLQSYSQLKY